MNHRKILDKRIMGVKLVEIIKVISIIIVVIIGFNMKTILGVITGSSTPIAVVEGYSMFPLLREGDIVFAYKPDPSDLHVGDIVIYRGVNSELVIHRIVDIRDVNGIKYYVTKGDNNNAPDYFQFEGKPGITYNRIEGKVLEINNAVVKIPYIGYLSIWYHHMFKH